MEELQCLTCVRPSDPDCCAVSPPFPKCVPGSGPAGSLWEFSISSWRDHVLPGLKCCLFVRMSFLLFMFEKQCKCFTFLHRSKGPIIYYWDLSTVKCKLVSFFYFLHFLFLKKLQSKISLVNAFWEEKWYLENPLLLFTRLRQEQEKPVLAGDGVFVNIFSF